MEVEVVDDGEFASIEAACLQAEQNINRSSPEKKPKRPRFLPGSLASVPPAPPLPFLIYRGKTTYCREVAQIDRAAAFLLAIEKPLGFDVEWHVTYETGKPPRPIALMQFCVVDPSIYTPDGSPPYHCFLLHINRKSKNNENNNFTFTPALSPRLLELLTSETVRKAGIGIHGDSLKVERDYGIKMKGLIDLSEAANARLCPSSSSSSSLPSSTKGVVPVVQAPQKWSMTALAENLMRKTVRKSQHIRCSDWEQDPLTAEQQSYAATDAWVSLQLHEILSSMPITWRPATATIGEGSGSGRVESSGAHAHGSFSISNNGNSIKLKKECIPACKELAALQPAKFTVLQQHYQGIEVLEIATQRQIQASTVQSYLAEAIIAGYAYNWDRLSVADEVLALAAVVAEEAGVTLLPPLEAVEYKPSRDILNELLEARNIKIRALFEEMQIKIPGLGFGDLRLAFAHLGRVHQNL
ncbi:hypothetical protein Ndes2526B_g03214 [Nannochloris sp. 'desiccata']|nr:hypothetical protein KSW81_006560 [Chlorella desiccata (nom. nud.)]